MPEAALKQVATFTIFTLIFFQAKRTVWHKIDMKRDFRWA